MASFAKIGLNGKVIEVLSVVDEVLHDSNGVEQEAIGIDFLTKLTGYPIWVQTSYNTYGGIHNKGKIPLRKNHASVGMTYDEDRDAFIPKKPHNCWILNEDTFRWEEPVSPKKPYPSWVLNEDTCIWEAPITMPIDDNKYTWNETNQSWDLTTI
jgi:hypothetical protein